MLGSCGLRLPRTALSLTGHFESARLTRRELVERLQSPAARTCPPGSRAALPLRRRLGVPRHGARRRRTTVAPDVPAAHRDRALRVHRPLAQAARSAPRRALRDALISP